MRLTTPGASVSRRPRALATTALVLLLAWGGVGCSGSGTTSAPATSPAPDLSASSASPSPAVKDNFPAAVDFTRAVLTDDFTAALKITSPSSSAARYIDHQKSFNQAREDNGEDVSEEAEATIKPNVDKMLIEIEQGDLNYAWKDFMYDSGGRVKGWTGASGPIDEVLWTKEDSSEALGVQVRLISAYLANSKTLAVIVEFKAHKTATLNYDVTYAASGGYKKKAYAQSNLDGISKGEKTLAYYTFKNAKFGGTLKLTVNSPDYTKTGRLDLKIR